VREREWPDLDLVCSGSIRRAAVVRLAAPRMNHAARARPPDLMDPRPGSVQISCCADCPAPRPPRPRPRVPNGPRPLGPDRRPRPCLERQPRRRLRSDPRSLHHRLAVTDAGGTACLSWRPGCAERHRPPLGPTYPTPAGDATAAHAQTIPLAI